MKVFAEDDYNHFHFILCIEDKEYVFVNKTMYFSLIVRFGGMKAKLIAVARFDE